MSVKSEQDQGIVCCLYKKKAFQEFEAKPKCIQFGHRSVVCLLIVLLTFAPEDFATHKQRGILATANKHVTDRSPYCVLRSGKIKCTMNAKLNLLRHFSWKYSPFLDKNQF